MSLLSIPCRVDWLGLAACAEIIKVTRGGCEWVSFPSIRQCLVDGVLEESCRPQFLESNHAARVADLVCLIERGTALPALWLNVVPAAPVAHAPRRRLEMWFEDGSHRFRAYEFLGWTEPLDVVLRGEPGVLSEVLSVAGENIEPIGPIAFPLRKVA